MNRKPRILVVDDEDIVRRSYRRVLEAAGCNAAVAPDGHQALHAMSREAFDVVLLDLRMPGVDGIAVLKAIKEKWPRSEVVVTTGFPSVESAKEAMRLGAYDYLAKPVEPDKVIDVAHGAAMHKHWALQLVEKGVPNGSAEKSTGGR